MLTEDEAAQAQWEADIALLEGLRDSLPSGSPARALLMSCNCWLGVGEFERESHRKRHPYAYLMYEVMLSVHAEKPGVIRAIEVLRTDGGPG